MAVAELAELFDCAKANATGRALADPGIDTDSRDCPALVPPSWPPGVAPVAPPPRWIASDLPPVIVQGWPYGVPVPPGWHEVDEMEANRLRGKPQLTIAGGLTGLPDASRLAALSTADSSSDVIADRRPGRTPREARFARLSRFPRAARAARVPRPARADRAPRRPRPPRRARGIRPPRPPRAPFKKTKYSVGVCKRPSCTCWTPAGCAAPWYFDFVKEQPAAAGLLACYAGPCWDYQACVTHKCVSDVACLLHQIARFWVQHYESVAVWVNVQTAPLLKATGLAGRQLLGTAAPSRPSSGPPPAGTLTGGCPPGYHWVVSDIGCSCAPPGGLLRAATYDDLVRCLGRDGADEALAGR